MEPKRIVQGNFHSILPNLIQVKENIYSGGSPINDKAFKSLSTLGIRTIISVDGAQPNIIAASANGMTYVHIHIGYDGISTLQKATLIEILKERPAPYYFHCHHGKHRGPAAVATILFLKNHFNVEQAHGFMQLAGTSKKYTGLWNSVNSDSDLKNLPSPSNLVERAAVSHITESMVAIDEIFDHLKTLEKNNWHADDTNPDITAHNQALLLLEQYKEIPRIHNQSNVNQPLFKQHLITSTVAAKELEQSFLQDKITNRSHIMDRLKTSCIDCHSDFRD